MTAQEALSGFPDLPTESALWNHVPAGNRASKAPVRKRARAVCRRCHEKKIRCDLDSRPAQSNQPCMNCANSKSECRPHPSRRNLHHRQKGHNQQGNPNGQFPPPSSANDTLNDASFPNPNTSLHGLLNLPAVPQVACEERHDGHPVPQEFSRPDIPSGQPLQPEQPFEPPPSNRSDNALVPSDLEQVTQLEMPPTASDGSGHYPEASYLGESGYMPFLSHEQHVPRKHSGGPVTIEIHLTVNPLHPALRKSYIETFLAHCCTFCPVLDYSLLSIPDFEHSLALQQSIGLVGSAIQPSLLHGDTPHAYYEKAKLLIQGGYEPNPLAALIAVMLFYWLAAASPTVVSMNSVWWWVGVSVRQAQELGLHREARTDQTFRAGESTGLRRRIWWTLFARERLTSICQGRPCIINPRDCDVREPTPEDFPSPGDPRAMKFVHWVRLCSIVGRVGDRLRRNPSSTYAAHDLLDELKEWAHALPEALRLPLGDAATSTFEADLFQLHLPYLSCITLLHMKKSTQSLPTANIVAILSASCTARIFEEFLVRGSLRFLQGMSGWYIAIALLALLHVRQVARLQQAADDHIQVLRVALRELAQRWDSAKMYDRSIEKILNAQQKISTSDDSRSGGLQNEVELHSVFANNGDSPVKEYEDGLKYFPGITINTSPLFEILLEHDQHIPFSDLGSDNDLSFFLYDIFDNPLDGINPGLSDHLTGWGTNIRDPPVE